MDDEKKYKEALERAKNIYGASESKDILSTLTTIFPELKEGEKIRKVLIDYFNRYKEQEECGIKTFYGIPTDNILAWLEKQDEKKSSDEVLKIRQEVYQSGYNDGYKHGCEDTKRQGEKKHKFNIGDIISNNNAIFRVDNIVKNCIGQDCYFLVNVESEKNGTRYLKLIDSNGKTHNSGEITWLCEQVDAKFEKQGYQKQEKFIIEPKFDVGDWIVQKGLGTYKIVEKCESWYEVISYKDGKQYSIGFDKENGCHIWTIQDAKDGDVLATPNYIYIFNSIDKETETVAFYCLMKKSDEHFSFGDYRIHDEILNSVPATKEQRDLLFTKMKEAGYEWDADKKKLNVETKFKVGDRIYEWDDEKKVLKKIQS